MSKYYIKNTWKVLSVSGADAAEHLHNCCTSKIIPLSKGMGIRTLVLNAISKITAPAFIIHNKESFDVICESGCFDNLESNLNSLLFGIDIKFETRNYDCYFIYDDSKSTDSETLFSLSCIEENIFFPIPIKHMSMAYTLDKNKKGIIDYFSENNITENTEMSFWEECRIKSLFPAFNQEWDHNTMALNAGFESWIDMDKGCFPGQEVVSKALYVGHPSKALILLSAEESNGISKSEKLFVEDKKVGELTSVSGEYALGVVGWKFRESLSFQTEKGSKYSLIQ